MSKLCDFDILENKEIASNTYSLVLLGDCSDIGRPGQFVNINISGKYLRRPISVCTVNEDVLTLVYKVVGDGTQWLSERKKGSALNVLTGLGNGFDTSIAAKAPLLVGGGMGAAPLYWLAETLTAKGISTTAVLGFSTAAEIILARELTALGVRVFVSTADGSVGVRGFVTDAIKLVSDYDYIFACGPEPMLQAVFELASACGGQYSFEERMGCGFGACMGCSRETVSGSKRICKDGPVMFREEIKWA